VEAALDKFGDQGQMAMVGDRLMTDITRWESTPPSPGQCFTGEATLEDVENADLTIIAFPISGNVPEF
jgi:hypothetical protein